MSRRNVQHLTISGISSEKESDLDELPHLAFGAGFPPYLRGHSTTMYINKPWTIRQYAGFSSAEESNAFYKKNLAGGHKTLIPEVIKQLKQKSSTPPSVFVGGIIPKEEYDFLKQEGVTCVFGPGFPVSKSAVIILQTLLS